jgi:hypothetical protein
VGHDSHNYNITGKEVWLLGDGNLPPLEKIICFLSFRQQIRGFCDLFRENLYLLVYGMLQLNLLLPTEAGRRTWNY